MTTSTTLADLQDQVKKMQKQVAEMESRSKGLLKLAGACMELYADLSEWSQAFKLTYIDDIHAQKELDKIMIKMKKVFKTYVETRD